MLLVSITGVMVVASATLAAASPAGTRAGTAGDVHTSSYFGDTVMAPAGVGHPIHYRHREQGLHLHRSFPRGRTNGDGPGSHRGRTTGVKSEPGDGGTDWDPDQHHHHPDRTNKYLHLQRPDPTPESAAPTW